MAEHPKVRKEWIDVLRALAIIFVIYGHLLEKDDHSFIYYVFTSPVKIPLFFAISGYLYKDGIPFKDFIKKIARGLIIPWLVLSLGPILLLSIIKGGNYLTSNILAIISGVSVWYMPCCIIAEIIFYLLLRSCKKQYILPAVALILSCAGVLLIKHSILDIFMLNRALSVQLFLLTGYYLHKYEHILDKVKTCHLWIGVAIYICIAILSIYFYPGVNLDVHRGEYYNYLVCALMIFGGCTLLFSIAKRFEFHSKVLSFIGRNTLIYYIWASYPVTIYNALTSGLGLSIKNIYINAFVETAFVCCVCAILAALVGRFLPEAVGRKRRKAGFQK